MRHSPTKTSETTSLLHFHKIKLSNQERKRDTWSRS